MGLLRFLIGATTLVILLSSSFLGIANAQANQTNQTFYKSNGIIEIYLNETETGGRIPVINRMKVEGVEVVFPYGGGADFQMASRSSLGDIYNPTQGGGEGGNANVFYPSILVNYTDGWSGNGLGIPSSNGILLTVRPRDYATGAITPYLFNFGVTLGGSNGFPQQMMILDMSIKADFKASTCSTQDLIYRLSEMPAIFPSAALMRYAFYSYDGIAFIPLLYNGSNDTSSWGGTLTNNKSPGDLNNIKTLMLCSSDAPINQNSGICMALYSNFPVAGGVSNRGILNAFGLTGGDNISYRMTDTEWHTLRRVLAVGNVQTIRAVISFANQYITDWGNWCTWCSPTPAAAPVCPTNVSASAYSPNTVQVTWQDNSYNEDKYDIYRLQNGGWVRLNTVPLPPDTTSYIDGGLQAGTTYTYWVVVTNSGGNNGVTTTVTTPQSVTAPASPTNFKAEQTTTCSVNLDWQDNSYNEDKYDIYRLQNGGWVRLNTVPLPPNTTSYIDRDEGLQAGTTYTYWVVVTNSSGNNGTTTTVTTTTP